MNQREKILVAAVGGLVGIFALGFGARALFIKPLRELDSRTQGVRDKLAKVQEERRAFFNAEDRLKALARRTYAETVDQASGISAEQLTRQILAAGLAESEFSRLPLGPRRLRGASEIGWNVQGEGPLTNVLNLLFLLDTSPWLHRLENLAVSTGDNPGSARVHFSLFTLVVEPPMGLTHSNLARPFGLDAPERRQYDGIVMRDLLRPYIKAPPPPPVPPAPAVARTKPGAAPGPENYKVVSLTDWEGQPEAHVRDLAGRKTARYKPGDAVGGGTFVMIDYRPLPDPGRPFIQSSSRLILKIEQEYWAIERGRTFADKHKLSEPELPPQLAKATSP